MYKESVFSPEIEYIMSMRPKWYLRHGISAFTIPFIIVVTIIFMFPIEHSVSTELTVIIQKKELPLTNGRMPIHVTLNGEGIQAEPVTNAYLKIQGLKPEGSRLYVQDFALFKKEKFSTFLVETNGIKKLFKQNKNSEYLQFKLFIVQNTTLYQLLKRKLHAL